MDCRKIELQRAKTLRAAGLGYGRSQDEKKRYEEKRYGEGRGRNEEQNNVNHGAGKLQQQRRR
jgi:hypothetical protein